MKTEHRPYYRTKAEWAEARLAELRAQFNARCSDRYCTSQRSAIRRKSSSLDHLSTEISRFSRLAERYRAHGM